MGTDSAIGANGTTHDAFNPRNQNSINRENKSMNVQQSGLEKPSRMMLQPAHFTSSAAGLSEHPDIAP